MLRWLKKRAGAHFAIAALFVIPILGMLSIVPNDKQPLLSKIRLWFDGWEYLSVDSRISFGRKAEASPQLVFLTIDPPSIALDVLDSQTIAASKTLTLMQSRGFPFPREVYAEACNRLIAAGARTVTFDLIFQKPFPTDSIFEQVLEKYHDHVVIGINYSDDSNSYGLPPPSLLPSEDPMDDRLGFLNYWLDSDNSIRRTQYRSNADYENHHVGAEKLPMLYSLAARTIQKAGHGDLVPNDFQPRQIRYAGYARFATYSFYKIFDPDSWKKDFKNGEYFRDKIVLVGPAGNWAKDQFETPVGLINGAEIHINAMNALLQNEFLHPTSNTLASLLVLGTGVIAFLLAMGIASIALRFLAALAVAGVYGAVVILAYNGPGWLLPVVSPLGVFIGATNVGFVYDFLLAQIEKLQLRATFERYTSPNVAKYLLDHADSYTEMLAGVRKPVTVLFSDVRNFTTMTEVAAVKGESQQHVAKLNEYLTAMVACVFRQDGSLDKFIGDAVMAVWGNTPYNFGPKEDAVRAVKAALEMNRELVRVNAGWAAQGRESWHIGIGLNHGDVIVGDMGSQQRKEFAVLGDAVNLASRLESLTKEYRLEILVGESVAELVRDRFHLRSVDLVQVKGKTEAVATFTVLGDNATALPPDRQKFLDLYEEGIRAFRDRKFTQAREFFAQALQIEPADHLTKEYVGSCDECIQSPPDETWTGVRVMTKK